MTSSGEALIHASGVRFSYGHTEILHGIDLDVPAGQITGVVGPSGHGKTTLINLIVGVLSSTSGELAVLGEKAPPRSVKPDIGYMPQSEALYTDLTAPQNLRFFGTLYGMTRAQVDEAIPRVLATVNLDAESRKTVAAFSGGMKRRLSLAIALLHTPRLLVLDEPTVGLDPAHRVSLWKTFRRMASEWSALLVTTHVMDEAASCDNLVMIHEGRVIAQGAPADLIRLTGVSSLEEAFLAFESGSATEPTPDTALSSQPTMPDSGETQDLPESEEVTVPGAGDSTAKGTVPTSDDLAPQESNHA